MLTSELATNACVHGRTPFEVRVETGDEMLRVTVADGNSRLPTPVEARSLESVGGQGLLLVGRLSRAWGWTPGKGGKRVWFELAPRPLARKRD